MTETDKKKAPKNRTEPKKSATGKTAAVKEKKTEPEAKGKTAVKGLKKNTLKAKTPALKNTDKTPAVKDDESIDPSAIARGDTPMTIVEHLNEIRSRLIIILSAFFLIAGVAFYFSDYLVYFINKPFQETGFKLNVFTLAGGFIIKMKVSAAIAVLIIVPLILFHIWRFISPAIEKPDRLFSRVTITSAVLLFYAGVCFVFLLLPSTIKVLLGFVDQSMLSTIGADDYLHFIFFLSFIMGFICELPIAILILTKIGLITPHFLISKRKYALVVIWITAAIVTPGPDLLSQSLVGVPLMFLYEVSIVISKFVLIQKKRKELKLRNH